MLSFQLLINGVLEDGSRSLPVINPATGEPFATCGRASLEQLNRAIDAATAAFPDWSARPVAERGALLGKMADVVEGNIDELGRLLTLEQGKPLPEAQMELQGVVAYLRFYAGCDIPDKVIEDSEARYVVQRRRPLGAVAAIVPWNFPLLLLSTKLGPALLTGNTVVAKPAPTTPVTTLRFAALIADLVPPGVINVIADDDDLGPALGGHPAIRKISFTGSTATGIKVMAGAANTLKRMTLELGGNDAAIVLDDVAPSVVAEQLFNYAFANNGQVCVAVKRLYVEAGVYDEICDALASIAKAAVVGNGLNQGTRLGPLQNAAQRDIVKTLVDDARQHGNIIAGGERSEGQGFFFPPTVVRDIMDGTRLVDEEQFGPVLPVIRVKDADDAVRRANASPYGLGASIWSSHPRRAMDVASRIEAGTVWINKHMDSAPHLPFAGAKNSGIGLEGGEEAIAEYTQMQIINVAR